MPPPGGHTSNAGWQTTFSLSSCRHRPNVPPKPAEHVAGAGRPPSRGAHDAPDGRFFT